MTRTLPSRAALACVAAVAGVIVWSLTARAAETTRPDAATRNITAARLSGAAPTLDGVPDDACWKTATPVDGFWQQEPDEGQASRERTTMRVLYDDAALYVACTMDDDDAAKIVRRLARRDEYTEADQMAIVIDPFHDLRNGFFFQVNASGVRRDAVMFNDGDMDDSWDGVWDASIHHRAGGWDAEFRIPFSQFRFPNADEQHWGFGGVRYISRFKETSTNFLYKKADAGFISLLGDLTGIRGVHPQRAFEFLPYALGSVDRDVNGAGHTIYTLPVLAGADLKFGLSNAFTLNATVHPDFGQIEADPAVLNLGPYETFFPEKRPFFLEGAKIFDNGGFAGEGGPPFYQFYSRRVGREPILGAAKVTGKIGHGTTVGVLAAATSPYRFLDWVGDRSAFAPGTATGDYEVVRVQQDILGNGSAIGVMGTRAVRPGSDAAVTGGADLALRTRSQRYSLYGQYVASRVPRPGGAADAVGHGLHLTAWKLSSKHTAGSIDFKYVSPRLQLNDLGYLRRPDDVSATAWFQYKENEPKNGWRAWRINASKSYEWNTSGLRLDDEWNANFHIDTKSYWHTALGVGFGLPVFDDRESRSAWPTRIPDGHWWWAYVESDSRKPVVVSLNPSAWANAGGSHGEDYNLSLEYKPATNVSLSFSPGYHPQYSNAQWVNTVDDTTAVFAEFRSHVLDLTMRANVTLTPTLSLQMYTQPFVATGQYTRFKRLAAPGEYGFDAIDDYATNARFNPDGVDPDFGDRSLRGNLVLRWEYRRASTLYVVWSEAREEVVGDGRFRPFHDLAHAVTAPGRGTLQVKMSYWMGH